MYKILILLILAMGNLHATDDEKKENPYYSTEDRKKARARRAKSNGALQPKIKQRTKQD